jgi:hypothetical protein
MNNPGLVLLTQTKSDFPMEVRATVFGPTWRKVVFGGIGPQDVDVFSKRFGHQYVCRRRRSIAVCRQVRRTTNPACPMAGVRARPHRSACAELSGHGGRASEIITGVPAGHSLVSLARSNGTRVGLCSLTSGHKQTAAHGVESKNAPRSHQHQRCCCISTDLTILPVPRGQGARPSLVIVAAAPELIANL